MSERTRYQDNGICSWYSRKSRTLLHKRGGSILCANYSICSTQIMTSSICDKICVAKRSYDCLLVMIFSERLWVWRPLVHFIMSISLRFLFTCGESTNVTVSSSSTVSEALVCADIAEFDNHKIFAFYNGQPINIFRTIGSLGITKKGTIALVQKRIKNGSRTQQFLLQMKQREAFRDGLSQRDKIKQAKQLEIAKINDLNHNIWENTNCYNKFVLELQQHYQMQEELAALPDLMQETIIPTEKRIRDEPLPTCSRFMIQQNNLGTEDIGPQSFLNENYHAVSQM